LPVPAFAKSGDFHPDEEFRLDTWVSIHVGPLDLSINKAVAYLALGSLLTIALGIGLMRLRLRVDPGTRQTIGESIYESIQTQIAGQGLPSKAIGRWFPYVASLFLFIWVVNLVSFVPLPITNDKIHVGGAALPAWGIYAVTSQLSVTLILALFSVVFTHVEGLRWNVSSTSRASSPPECRNHDRPMAVLETISHLFRVVSLSVRLYANMLAGHMLILISIGLLFILSGVTLFIAVPISFAIGVAFYFFEVAIVATIQAFIFAALTAIYIGSAIEPSTRRDTPHVSSSRCNVGRRDEAARLLASAWGWALALWRRHWHRHGFRLDDPVGRAPAGAPRRAPGDHVARIRTHRGGRLLRPRRRVPRVRAGLEA